MKTFDFVLRLTPSIGSLSRVEPRTKSESRLTLSWNRFWQRIVEGLMGSSELQVWQQFDRHNTVLWRGYDPLTGNSFSGSEAEMRSWIEERYYN